MNTNRTLPLTGACAVGGTFTFTTPNRTGIGRALLLLLLPLGAPLLFAEESPVLPKVPPDWKVEIIKQAPEIHHPSVICAAPDGRIFVGQDPMDMMLPGDKPADSVVCIHPDGRVTTFATGLYAVFGLAYLDGKLFVHHSPKLTVFTDDNGVGKDPVELFTTNPKPWGGTQLNDHIPANMRLGMDGFFYMAVGDKGIYGAVGKDGSKAELLGGGILRFRPDGTQLEVVATGTRNHLDVALNAEDEMFTWDNTDDGNGWWARVTHMVDRGFYGYPFDYKPRRPYTLWRMEEYGGGSPTGAVAYNEDALPAEYRGNLFLCEWGKRQLARFIVARDGGTYKIVKRTEMADAGKVEFRPLGITTAPDGMGFLVADWAYGGWRGKMDAGRVLRFTFTGKSEAAPKPGWWQAAAMGQRFAATTPQLVEGLKHPAQSVRLVAQRRLAERGAEAVAPVVAVLGDASASAEARMQAVWTLDAIDGGKAARAAVLAALSGKDHAVRAQAIRQLGTRKVAEAVPALIAALQDDDAAIRFRAATALGRIGDVAAAGTLIAALGEKDLFARYAIFTALNHLGRAHPAVWTQLARGLAGDDAAIREGALFAMRETFDEGNVKALAAFVADAKAAAAVRAPALATLAALHRQSPPWDGSWWSTQPVKSPPPPRAVAWAGTPVVLAAVRAALQDPAPAVRLAAIEAVQTTREAESAPALRALFPQSDPAAQRLIVRALGSVKDAAAVPMLAAVFAKPEEHSALLPDTITAAGEIGDAAALTALTQYLGSHPKGPLLKQTAEALAATKSPAALAPLVALLRSTDAAEREAATAVLPKFGSATVTPAVKTLLDDPSMEVRRAALSALGGLKDKKLNALFLPALKHAETRTAAIFALTQAATPDALDAYLDGLADSDEKLREASRKAIEAMRSQVLPALEARHRQSAFPAALLTQLQRAFASDPQAISGPLFENAPAGMRSESYEKWAAKNPGDAKKGRKLVHEGAAKSCLQCHRFEKEGGDLGPELSSIGSKYRREQLIESVLYPSKQIFDGYELTTVTLKAGGTMTGMLRQETPEQITLVELDGKRQVVLRKDVQESKRNEQSLMPDGLHLAFSPQDLSDLVSYMESLKGLAP